MPFDQCPRPNPFPRRQGERARPLAYRPEIDGLRALAVLLVVLYHLGFGLPGGYVGVDIFFVISGFLITSLVRKELAAGTFTLVGFYERRARRILPASLVMTAVTLGVAAWRVLPSDLEAVSASVVAHALCVANVYFYRNATNYFGGPAGGMPLLHTWSLGVEEQFYVVFPPLLIACRMLTRRRFGRLSAGVVLTLAVAGWAWAVYAVPLYPVAGFFPAAGAGGRAVDRRDAGKRAGVARAAPRPGNRVGRRVGPDALAGGAVFVGDAVPGAGRVAAVRGGGAVHMELPRPRDGGRGVRPVARRPIVRDVRAGVRRKDFVLAVPVALAGVGDGGVLAVHADDGRRTIGRAGGVLRAGDRLVAVRRDAVPRAGVAAAAAGVGRRRPPSAPRRFCWPASSAIARTACRSGLPTKCW